ncbi:hypothetical protein CR513_37567, partial [Mucuna pruriens]
MCLTLQEIESDQLENVGAIGGYQNGKQPHQSRPLDNQQTESRALCISTIRIHTEYLSKTSRLSTANSAISSPTFPTIAAIENAASRKFSIFGGSNEVASNQQPRVPTICELQQHEIPAKYDRHHSRPQDADRTSAGSSNLPSQTIPNPRGNASAIMLRCGKELSQPAPQLSRSVEADSESDANSKLESDEELLKMFRKVEINIPLLDVIKQIPNYVKFLKGSVEVHSKHCQRNAEILESSLCTIGDCTFVDAMLDLGASINVMPTSIYKSLNFGDLEPTRMTIQLANRSVVQPLGVLEDVLVQ